MPKTLMQSVADQLQRERARLAKELRAVSAALTAFGKTYASGNKAAPIRKKRTMSAAARKKIAAAQRARWAKVRAGKKH
jgi:hypothetical protein